MLGCVLLGLLGMCVARVLHKLWLSNIACWSSLHTCKQSHAALGTPLWPHTLPCASWSPAQHLQRAKSHVEDTPSSISPTLRLLMLSLLHTLGSCQVAGGRDTTAPAALPGPHALASQSLYSHCSSPAWR